MLCNNNCDGSGRAGELTKKITHEAEQLDNYPYADRHKIQSAIHPSFSHEHTQLHKLVK